MFLIKVYVLLCIRPFSDVVLRGVCSQWRQQSQLLADSDFTLVEPILAARSVAQQTLMSRVADPDGALSSTLTDHLMELCRLARRAGNTQVRRAQVISLPDTTLLCSRCCASSTAGGACHLSDEAAWHGGVWGFSPRGAVAAGGSPSVLGEGRAGTGPGSAETDDRQPQGQGEAQSRLNVTLLIFITVRKIQSSRGVFELRFVGQVDFNPAVVPVYTECLRLCGNWLAETCLESPGVILEKYLERVGGTL